MSQLIALKRKRHQQKTPSPKLDSARDFRRQNLFWSTLPAFAPDEDEDQRDRSPEEMGADVRSVYSIVDVSPSLYICIYRRIYGLTGLPTDKAVPNFSTLGETDREENEKRRENTEYNLTEPRSEPVRSTLVRFLPNKGPFSPLSLPYHRCISSIACPYHPMETPIERVLRRTHGLGRIGQNTSHGRR